jgi:vacuolar-type H+-ATPase subunit I/STV1
MREKLERVCDSFLGKRYSLPGDGHGPASEFRGKVREMERKIAETKLMMSTTREQMGNYLESINRLEGVEYSILQVYKLFIAKEKSVFAALNKLKPERKLFYGYFWCPLTKDKLQSSIFD